MGKYLVIALFCLSMIACQSENENPGFELYPTDHMFMQRAYPYGKLDQKAYRKALNTKQEMSLSRSVDEEYDLDWEFQGPTNIGGRITDLEMFEDNMNTIFACTASGGIFRSDDRGVNWYPIFDDALSLSIGDMAIAKSNKDIMYVGTGESNAGGGSLAYDGIGVYKSTDGGTTWNAKGLENAGSIGKVIIHPTNPDVVLAATMGSLFENNSERGVYRTKDGGDSWEQVLFVSDSTGAIDLAIDPLNPHIIYAAMWERIRRVNYRQYGGETSGIYKSTDGGDSWQEITNGLPFEDFEKGRIGLAIAESNPNTIYAFYAQTGGSIQGVYKSVDGGAFWTEMSISGITNVPFMWWFGKIFVDPTDEEIVFATSLNMSVSRNGGNSWGAAFLDVHVDQHAIYIHPLDPQLVINGNDGGVYISEDGGFDWTKADNLPITQFYRCELDPNDIRQYYGGSQDNRTIRTPTGSEDDWEILFGGDGFTATVDPTNSNIIYAISQNGRLGKSTNGGQNFSIVLDGIENSELKNWNTPYVLDPNNSNILYYGAERLYKSTNKAELWSPLSEKLTGGPYSGNLAYGTITSISVNPSDSDIIVVGTDDGKVWRTDNGGIDFVNLEEGFPNRWVTGVATNPIDPNKHYVSLSGFRFGENVGQVYEWSNATELWKNISYNLPDIPVNDIIVDDKSGVLYIATDVGVFYFDGIDWLPLGQGLPNVPMVDLDFHSSGRILTVATYGRSMYSYPLPQSVSTDHISDQIKASVFPNPTSEYLNIVLDESGHENVEMRIIDAQGIQYQIIQPNEINLSRQLDVSKLAPGLYYLIISSRNKESQYPFIKVHFE